MYPIKRVNLPSIPAMLIMRVISASFSQSFMPRLTLISPARRKVVISNFPTEIIGRLFKHSGYAVTIFNVTPSLVVLHFSALTASDWVLVPTKLDAIAVDGVNEVLHSIVKLLSVAGRLWSSPPATEVMCG
jgi:cellulose biosynthesis protein BcsQ